MARGSLATLAAFACGLRGAASLVPGAPGGACLTVQSAVAVPVVLARSCLENQTLDGGATVSLNVSVNETLWVVPAGAEWNCELGCLDCFSLTAEVTALELEAGDNTSNASNASNTSNTSNIVRGPENSTVASIRLGGGPASTSGCLSAVLEGPAEDGPTPLLRGGWWAHGGGHHGYHPGGYHGHHGYHGGRGGGGGGCYRRCGMYGCRRVCGGYHYR